jgi:hypothetical protein
MNEKRTALNVVIVAILSLGYYLLSAQPLGKELVLSPTWATAVKVSDASAMTSRKEGDDEYYPFRLGDQFGYVGSGGHLLFAQAVQHSVALSEGAYANYPSDPSSLSFSSPDGKKVVEAKTRGYPFFAGSRRFVVSSDSGAVSEYDSTGARLWRREFPCVVTAADFSADRGVVGMLDGEIEVVGPKGELVFPYRPGGSRVEAIYGAAISSDGRLVALVSGLDPQRLIVLERRADEYATLYHRDLDSEFRGPVRVTFTKDSRYLFLEQKGSVAVLDTAGNSFSSLPVSGDLSTIETEPYGDLFLALSKKDRDWSLAGFRLPSTSTLSIPFSAFQAFLFQKGEAIYLGIDGKILRVDMKEG